MPTGRALKRTPRRLRRERYQRLLRPFPSVVADGPLQDAEDEEDEEKDDFRFEFATVDLQEVDVRVVRFLCTVLALAPRGSLACRRNTCRSSTTRKPRFSTSRSVAWEQQSRTWLFH